MADTKSTSRIIYEMDEIMRGLDRCKVPSAIKLGKFKGDTKDKARRDDNCDEIVTDKSQADK